MPPPKVESWLLESKLIAYKHYIPLSTKGDDLIEKLEWAYNHTKKCRSIALESTRFVLGHPYYARKSLDHDLRIGVVKWFVDHVHGGVPDKVT